MMYQGYVEREKSADFRTAWSTALVMNMWRGEHDPVITAGDILPWVNDAQPQFVKKNKKLEAAYSEPEPVVNHYDYAVKSYAKTAGINLDELSPEELAELEVEAINRAIGSDLGAPGVKMFGRAPKEWGNFPE